MERDLETELYRLYVTESLRLRGEGKYLPSRWADWVHPKNIPDDDPESVIADLVAAGGLQVV